MPYLPSSNLLKDKNGDLLADFYNISNRWKKYFFRLRNVHNVSDVRQIEVHTAEPLVPGPSSLEVEIAIAKLKKYKSPGSDQIPSGLIQAGGETLVHQIKKLTNSVWNEDELHDQWKWKVPIHKKGDKTDCSNYRGTSLLSISCNISSDILLSRLGPQIDEIIGDHQCGFRHNISHTDQIFCIRQILDKKWEYNETVDLLVMTTRKPMIQ
jgi:hypothetical protein